MTLDRPLVLGLGGTGRPGSSSERALRLALAAAQRAGARVELLGAARLALPMYAPEDPHRTGDAQRLVALAAAADGVVIATPGYHGGPSGLVKNALDYLEDLRADPRPYLDGRAVGCIVSAAGAQAAVTTLSALRSVVHALRGWPTPLGVTIDSLVTRDGVPPVEEAAPRLELLGRQVAEFALLQRTRTRPGVLLPLLSE